MSITSTITTWIAENRLLGAGSVVGGRVGARTPWRLSLDARTRHLSNGE